jgi:WD40 repeat protein
VYGHGAGISDLAYSANGEYLASVADDGLIGLWGSSDAPGLISRPVAPDARSPSPSDDGSRMLILHSVLGHPEVRSGDAPTDPGIRVTTPEGATWGKLSDDGRLVLAANVDTRTLAVSDAQTGGPLWTNTDEDFPTGPADIDGGSGFVVATDDLQTELRVWDTTTGRIMAEASAPDLPGVSAEGFSGWPRFTDDGSFIDIPVAYGVGRFRAEDLDPVAYVPLSFVAKDVESVPGSDDLLAVGSSGRLARVNIATGAVEAEGRSADPSDLGFVELSPDGTIIAAYHPFSYQLALFDAATLRPLGEPFPVGDFIFEPHFTADGREVIGNGLFLGWAAWDVDPDVWQQQACLASGRNLTEAEWNEYLGPDEPYRATCDR